MIAFSQTKFQYSVIFFIAVNLYGRILIFYSSGRGEDKGQETQSTFSSILTDGEVLRIDLEEVVSAVPTVLLVDDDRMVPFAYNRTYEHEYQ